jgi:hypothetical protein
VVSEKALIELLARITNAKLHGALARGTRAGENIPDYAWTPLPADVTDDEWDEIRAFVRPAAEACVRDLLAEKADPLW